MLTGGGRPRRGSATGWGRSCPLGTAGSAPSSSVLGQLAALPPPPPEVVEDEEDVDDELLDDSLLALVELDDESLAPLDSLAAAGAVELSALRLSVR